MHDPAVFYDASWDKWSDMIRYSPAPRLRRALALRWLRGLGAESLLDVGCGNGEFLHEARIALPGLRLAGVDVSPAVIARNQAQGDSVDYGVLDLDREQLPERYDAVVCMEVVEHCADPGAVLARLAAMTGRHLFLTVPSGPLFPIDRAVGHVRHFRPEDLIPLLGSAGLREVAARRYGFPFFNLYKHAINLRPAAMQEAFLSERPYGPAKKLLAHAAYAAFRSCLPWGGYQLVITARR